jgi:hypothetical protein
MSQKTPHLHYKDEYLKVLYGNKCCFYENYTEYGKKQTFLKLKQLKHIYTSVLEGVSVLSKVLNYGKYEFVTIVTFSANKPNLS